MTEPQNPPPWTEPGAPAKPTETTRRRAAWLLWALLGIAVLAVAVLAFLLLRGNADEPADDAAATPSQTATETPEPEATPEPTETPAEPSEPPVDALPLKPPEDSRFVDGISAIPTTTALEDGDYFAFLRGVDVAGGTVQFDVAIFYVGQAANDYLTAEDPTAEIPPPNDYIIVNESDLVRTLPLAADVRVWDWCMHEDSGLLGFAERTVAEWAAAPAGGEVFCDAGAALSHGWNENYWFDVRAGEIKQIIGVFRP